MRPFKEIFDVAMSMEYAMSEETFSKAKDDISLMDDHEKILCDIISINNYGTLTNSYGISRRTKIGKRRVKKVIATLVGQGIIYSMAAVDDEGYMCGRGYCYLGSKI